MNHLLAIGAGFLLLSASCNAPAALTGNLVVDLIEGRGFSATLSEEVREFGLTLLLGGYVEGVNFTAAIFAAAAGTKDGQAPKLLCPEKHSGVNTDQLRRMIIKAANEHPENLSENIGVLIYPVLFQAYKCE
jgi:hypothetical protein